VVSQYLICYIELAKQALQLGNYSEAIKLLNATDTYPDNLGEGKLFGVKEPDIFYLKGLAYEALGDTQTAQSCYERASEGQEAPVQAVFYNDQQPDKLFYQGLAWKKLGRNERAEALFNTLIQYGETHQYDAIKIDYFAVSLPDLLVFDADLNERNRISCQYLMGLGYLGLGNGHIERAIACFDAVLASDSNHQGAALHRKMVEFLATQEV
jgi:tetratricopeptide (TPR) repeat protein